MEISLSRTLLFLVLPLIFVILMIFWLSQTKRHSQMKPLFIITLSLLGFWFLTLLLQILFSTYYNVNPLIFENLIYISACLAPIFIYFISLVFKNSQMKFTTKYLLYFVIPLLTLIMLWTNNYHHLFYIDYSIDINKTTFGAYFYIHSLYTYSILLLGLCNLIIYSIKTSGIFSKQSIMFFIGTLIPVSLNLLGTFKIIPMTIYITPISFSLGLMFYAISIFKFDFLNVTPIALDLVVNTMNDGYIVLDNKKSIISYNNSFLNFFSISKKQLQNASIFDIETFDNLFSNTELSNILNNSELGKRTEIEKVFKENYFMLDISPIYKDKIFIGTLIFITDITQHKKDMEIIRNNQDMLIERERLASLGQMVGGIAHSLKTPIFSISGGLEGLSDLIKEFDESIEDPTVNSQDMHDIAKDMTIWIDKMKTHLSYMSEVITTVKGQAVTLSGDDTVNFTISEVFSHTSILMKHELQSALVTLNMQNNVNDKVILNGNINSLVQVLNNLISNAIQAYNKKPNEKIDLKANLVNNNIIISIRDYGPGLPNSVKDKLFKEMITTKGKEGTGLGVFMSYSMIKAKFNGNITFETSSEGTQFDIILPL